MFDVFMDGSDIWAQLGKIMMGLKIFELPNGAIMYEYLNGKRYWYYQGKQLDCKTLEECDRLMKLKAFW
jgi:hypothetical protein